MGRPKRRERPGETFTHVSIERAVQLPWLHIQHILEHLGRTLSLTIRAEDVDQRLIAPIALDQLAHQRREVVGKHDLLGIFRPHESVVQLADLVEPTVHIRHEERNRGVGSPTLMRPPLLEHGESLREPSRHAVIG